MRRVNFRNANATTAFTTQHAVGFEQTFRDVSLAHRRAHDVAAVLRGDQLDRLRCGNVRDHGAALFAQANISRECERHLFGKRLAEIGDDAETFAVSVVCESYVRVSDRKSTRLNSSHIPLSRMP